MELSRQKPKFLRSSNNRDKHDGLTWHAADSAGEGERAAADAYR